LQKRTLLCLLGFFLFCSLLFGSVAQAFASNSLGSYLSVPFHFQETGYYCGPASLEMIFDFYGPDVSQIEIAEAANTIEYEGTSLYDLVRAAHFSNLGVSIGKVLPWNIKGYSTRELGYAAFSKYDMTLEELESLVADGYPIIVCMAYSQQFSSGHFRVVVGYNETHITLHDPWFQSPYEGPNLNMTYPEFLYLWEFSSYWGLFVSPWKVSIHVPENVEENQVFYVEAAITYTCPESFLTSEYPASSVNATITLPKGLRLLPGEQNKKPIDVLSLYPGNTVSASWSVKADELGDYGVSIEGEGKISSEFPYAYWDRIGGSDNIGIHVNESTTSLIGDINHDGTVNILDITSIAFIYGCNTDDPYYSLEADLAPQYGKIDILDLVTCASHYGEKYP
jgi:predicted double-glycine peptidase